MLVVVAVFVVAVGFADSYDDAPKVLVLVVREDVSDDAYDDPTDDCVSVDVVVLKTLKLEGGADVKLLELVVLVLVVREDVSDDISKVLVLVVRDEVSDDPYDDETEDCEFIEVVSLAAVVREGGADVKILELVVLVLVVRENVDVVEDVIEDA